MYFFVTVKKNFDPELRRCVAAWVNYKMKLRRLNNEAMGKLMGVAPQTVSRIKNEKRTAGLDFVVLFSKEFDVPLESLVYTRPTRVVVTGEERG